MKRKIKRFGTNIQGIYLSNQIINEMNWEYYIGKVRKYAKSNKVCIVKMPSCHVSWIEEPLCEWFEENFIKLGFEKIIKEKTSDYMALKEKMGFYGYPDYLAFRNGRWIRVEVECFSEQYLCTHSLDYADVILCYDITKPIPNKEVVSLREIMGCEEIINQWEIPEFLYLYDKEFKKDYNKRMFKHLVHMMGKME